MSEYLKINKPYTVVEGIASDIQCTNDNYQEDFSDDIKYILYAGSLHERFGVKKLVDAFCSIKDENIRLIVCGVGDSQEWINDISQKDKRVIFKGRLLRNHILELYGKVDIIVNPRGNDEQFTKFSFPSKNLEALSSGTPLLAYKLDGIPDEYDDYIYYINGNEINNLKEMIKLLCNKPKSELNDFGLKAKKWVQTEKNKYVQTKKICDLLNNLY